MVDAAQKHPRKFGHVIEEMDKTGKVDKAYREVLGRTRDPADAPIRLDPHDRLRHDQDRLSALYVKDAAKYQEYRVIDAHITKAVNDEAERKQLFPHLARDEDEPRPPTADIERNAALDPASIVPENAPPTAPADDWPEMPDFLRRKQEIEAALLERMPYLKDNPMKLEAMVLDRIR